MIASIDAASGLESLMRAPRAALSTRAQPARGRAVYDAAMAAEAGATRLFPPTGEFLRELAISILIGLGVVFLVLLGESARLTPNAAAYGAMIGSFAYVT